MKTLREKVAAMLVLALRLRKWKRKELAARLGVTPPRVTAILSGKENLTLQEVERVLGVLGFRLVIWLGKKHR